MYIVLQTRHRSKLNHLRYRCLAELLTSRLHLCNSNLIVLFVLQFINTLRLFYCHNMPNIGMRYLYPYLHLLLLVFFLSFLYIHI